MSYEQTVAPTVNAISDQEAKDHLRVDITDEDTLIGLYVDVAEDYAEQKTNIQHITATWKLRLDEFPIGSIPIIFERNPVQSIVDIKYVDIDGVTQTWANNLYELDSNSRPGRLRPIESETYPSTFDQFDAVTIQFKAGYGDASSSVPDERKAMLLLMVAYLFDNRNPTHTMQGESLAVAWPDSVERLLALGSLKNFS
ncbi:MAG: phage head-tail connector protein [Flavobacteriales bacterium]|nr:phage head-tail connector protein [Flavobacteriales bacterium]